MAGIGIRITLEELDLAASNASNPAQIVGIGIRMPRMLLEWLELAFECCETRLNGWNCHSNASNSRSNGLNWHSNASNPVRTV